MLVKRVIFITFQILLLFTGVYGQRFIKGRVMDTAQHTLVTHAVVRLQGSDGSDIEVRADSLGYYVIDSGRFHSNVNYYIKASALWYFQSQPIYIQGLHNTIDTLTENFQLYHPYVCDVEYYPAVLFAKDSYTVTNAVKDSLNVVKRILLKNPTLVMEFDGHADDKRSNKYDMSLSFLRAKSCTDYMISVGIDSNRIIPVGWGNKKMLVHRKEIRQLKTQAQKDSASQINKRVVFQVRSWDYHTQAQKSDK